MATFLGTSLSEEIRPGFVSPTVSATPAGSFPSDLTDFISSGGGSA